MAPTDPTPPPRRSRRRARPGAARRGRLTLVTTQYGDHSPELTDHHGDSPESVFAPSRVRAYRAAATLSVETLADRAGLTVESVHAIENGDHTPTPTELTALAEALNRPPEALCGPPGLDPATDYRQTLCAALPPMSAAEIAVVGMVLRRIDDRMRSRHTREEDPGQAAA